MFRRQTCLDRGHGDDLTRMIELTERTQKALAAPMAALLPADVRALILDLARSSDSAREHVQELRQRVEQLEKGKP